MQNPRPSFPIELEELLLELCRAKLGVADRESVLQALEPAAARLSDLFTVDRAPGFEGYGNDADLLLAYLLFFFPQTYIRTLFVLFELAEFRRVLLPPPSAAPVRVLDLGSGTGAAGLAVASWLSGQGAQSVEMLALDRSAQSLRLQQEILSAGKAFWPGVSLRTQCGDLLRPGVEGPWDVVVASFSLNEALEGRRDADAGQWLGRTLGQLAPGGFLLVVEPATQAAAGRLVALRDQVAASGSAQILGPCLHAAPCPMRGADGGWCHEVRRWQIPETLEILNRRLFRPIQFLKFSFLALARTRNLASAPDPWRVRLVAPMNSQKGAIRTFGCGADGQLRPFEIQTRGLSRAEVEGLLAVERGDILGWPRVRVLGDGRTCRAEESPDLLFGYDE